MTLQHNNDAVIEFEHRNTVYSLFAELAEVTEKLIEQTDQDEFTSMQPLVQRREACILRLSELHTMEQGSMKIYGADDEQMKEIVARVIQCSQRMQSVMEHKSKLIVTTLSNLQNQKMYHQ